MDELLNEALPAPSACRAAAGPSAWLAAATERARMYGVALRRLARQDEDGVVDSSGARRQTGAEPPP